MTETAQRSAFTTADPELVRRLLVFGGDDLNMCYQCGTCSVVCPLTPDDQAFPRKEMLWAQWGLQDKLLSDGDAWLCHQCNECSTHCPRDAKPGDLMAATRTYQIEEYATFKVLAKATNSLKYLPLAFIPPVLLTFFMVLFGNILPNDGLFYPEGDVLFENFLGHNWIQVFTFIALGFMAVVSWRGAVRFWKAIRESEVNPPPVRKGFIGSLLITLGEIGTHKYFKMCKANKPRGFAHMGILWGFLFLFIATTLAFFYGLFGRELSLPIYDPAKIVGNVGGIALFVGLTWVSARRLLKSDEAGKSRYFDWYFIGVLYMLTLSGFAVEAVRYTELREWAYSLYMIHLVFYFMLFTYLPYTKFSHVVYRTLALTHARQIGRSPGTRREVVVDLP
jgi:quinone-modifying oxidoreductase subunit QmoC